MIRQFISFPQAAAMLDCEPEGLRQAFELGLLNSLPAYLYAGGDGLDACFTGTIGEVTDSFIDGFPNSSASISGIGEFTADDWHRYDWHRDPFCSIQPSWKDQKETGSAFSLQLQGYFRVPTYLLREGALSPSRSLAFAMPNSWWAASSPIPKRADGDPTVELMLLLNHEMGNPRLPKFSDLVFRINDVEMIKSSRMHAKVLEEGDSIEPRKETSLLVIIGALASRAKLDLTHPHSAAKEVAGMLDDIGVHLSTRIIGEHLKNVRDAMDKRGA